MALSGFSKRIPPYVECFIHTIMNPGDNLSLPLPNAMELLQLMQDWDCLALKCHTVTFNLALSLFLCLVPGITKNKQKSGQVINSLFRDFNVYDTYPSGFHHRALTYSHIYPHLDAPLIYLQLEIY